MTKWGIFFTMLLIAIVALNAQWSGNAENNTVINVEAGSQVLPKVAHSSSSEYYVSWFSAENGNYNVRLQRLNLFGEKLWEDEGLLISAHPSMSWLTDYDLKADDESNAIIAFQDIRNGGNNNIYAYKISPEGDFLWGNDGLELSATEAFDASPKIAVTSNNNVIIAWFGDDITYVKKIDSNGNLIWEEPIALQADGLTYSWPQLLAVENDSFIMKYFEDSGPYYSPTRHTFAQKYDAEGNEVWESPVIVSDAGGISAWTQILPICSDGENGFFIGWNDDRDQNNLSEVYVQHIMSNGVTAWDDNGIVLCQIANRNRFYPQIFYSEQEERLYAIWSEMDGDQNERGIYGQSVDLQGNLTWGTVAIPLIELGGDDPYPISLSDHLALIQTSISAVDNRIIATSFDANGDFVWGDEFIDISTHSGEKMHHDCTELEENQVICVWEDLRDDGGDIYAQNVTPEGTIGVIYTTITDLSAEYISPNVHINWTTGYEYTIAGWNLFRSDNNDFSSSVQINPELIDGAGTTEEETYYEYINESNLVQGETYYYWIEYVNYAGFSGIFDPVDVTIPITGTGNSSVKVHNSAYPNPINLSHNANIQFNIPLDRDNIDNPEITIYNVLGQKIKTVKTENKGSALVGYWNLKDNLNKYVATGIYLYKIQIGNKQLVTKKIMVLK